MRQIKTNTLAIDAPVVVAHRSVSVSRSIVNCAVLQSPAVCVHQPRIVGRLRVVCRTSRLLNRAQPVIHPVNQRSRMVPAFQPALFDDQERFVPPHEGWAAEEASLDQSGPISPSLPDFLGAPDILELSPGTTIGVLDLLRVPCIVGPVSVVRLPKADWPLRVSWSLLLPPLDMVCRSASRDPRTAERLKQAVISILAARSQESADAIAQRLRCSEYRSPVFQGLVNRLAQWPTEYSVATRQWGQDECSDALRARWICKWTEEAQFNRVWSDGYSWIGSLRWVGQQLLQQRIPRASPGRLRFFAAAIASADGWSAAVQQIVRRALESHALDAEVYRWTSALALRAVLNDQVDEILLNALVPRAALWLSGEGNQHPIPPAVLALRHLVHEKRQGSALLLLARIVSTRFKMAVRMMMPLPSRGNAGGQSEEKWLEMLVSPPSISREAWSPWGQRTDILAFDYEGLETILTQYLGTDDPQIIWPILIDKHLQAAVLLAISGHTLSAKTQLGTRPERDRWSHAEGSIRGILARRKATPGLLWQWMGRQVENADIEGLLANLVETPDPSVETGTPVSLLRIQSSWASELNRTGRSAQFRALRRVFDRPDLMRQHEPYWILQLRHRKALLFAIASLARSNTPIGDSSWHQAAQDAAREILAP